jgi:hypothetical protein
MVLVIIAVNLTMEKVGLIFKSNTLILMRKLTVVVAQVEAIHMENLE